MVGVQADEIITIVDVLRRTCLAAAQGCFKRSIRCQSRRNHVCGAGTQYNNDGNRRLTDQSLWAISASIVARIFVRTLSVQAG